MDELVSHPGDLPPGDLGLEAQALRYRAHDKLMRAFLDDAVYDGRVRVEAEPGRRAVQQTLLAD